MKSFYILQLAVKTTQMITGILQNLRSFFEVKQQKQKRNRLNTYPTPFRINLKLKTTLNPSNLSVPFITQKN